MQFKPQRWSRNLSVRAAALEPYSDLTRAPLGYPAERAPLGGGQYLPPLPNIRDNSKTILVFDAKPIAPFRALILRLRHKFGRNWLTTF